MGVNVSFTATSVGEHAVDVQVKNQRLPGSPFRYLANRFLSGCCPVATSPIVLPTVYHPFSPVVECTYNDAEGLLTEFGSWLLALQGFLGSSLIPLAKGKRRTRPPGAISTR